MRSRRTASLRASVRETIIAHLRNLARSDGDAAPAWSDPKRGEFNGPEADDVIREECEAAEAALRAAWSPSATARYGVSRARSSRYGDATSSAGDVVESVRSGRRSTPARR